MFRKCLVSIAMITLIAAVPFAQERPAGVLSNNIILEDLEGKTYDMHSELSKGKHILLFATFIT